MPKIVDSWQLPFRGDDAAFLKQGTKTELQARAAVRSSSPAGGVPDEGRIRGNGRFLLGSGTQIPIDLIGNTAMDRKQARFIKLRLPNV